MTTDINHQKSEEKAQILECALPTGTVLRGKSGREYKITEVLGAGGFGITYKAVGKVVINKETNYSQMATFAIKEFFMRGCSRDASGTDVLCSSSLRSDMEAGKSDFRKEAEVLVNLNGKSPHIVMVNEQFEACGTWYYVMDYLDGKSLQQHIDALPEHSLLERQALAWLLPIARAVALLHSHHLLHLDIKPENIMLKHDPLEGTVTPVLIDFGLAKHFNKKGKPTSRLVARGATEGYAPLEQFGNIASFSPAMDVYALGATLYFMLTGKTPPGAYEVFTMSVSAFLQKNLPASVSPQVRKAIERAMQPSVNDRMRTVDEFVEALANCPIEPQADNGRNISGTGMSGSTTVAFGQNKKRFHFRKKHVIIGITILLACVLALYGFLLYKEINTPEWKAKHGDMEAQYYLGHCYMDGEGVIQNNFLAAYWYEKAAEQGHMEAQRNLAICYEQGTGVTYDSDMALFWYKKAAEQGDCKSQLQLGSYYLEGDNKEYGDNKKAMFWYEKAAEQGSASAQCQLGNFYYHGDGVPQNYEKAMHWYEKAAEKNDAEAQYMLGAFYAMGIGVPQNDETAEMWLKKAEDNGYYGRCTLQAVKAAFYKPKSRAEAERVLKDYYSNE